MWQIRKAWLGCVLRRLVGRTSTVAKQSGKSQPADLQSRAVEKLTACQAGWPELSVRVKGHDLTCAGILRVRDIEASGPARTERQPQSAFAKIALSEDPQDLTRMDSIWELDLESERSVLEESDSPYSEESVLD